MNQTANYQLNQWEKPNRILMEDFNNDNAKIDAALVGLDRRVGLKTLLDATVTEAAQTVNFPVDVDWSRWRTLYFYVSAWASGGTAYRVGCQSGGKLSLFSGISCTGAVRIIAWPLCDGETSFHGLLFKTEATYFDIYAKCSTIRAFSLYAPQTDSVIGAGSRMIIQGAS